MGWRADRVQRRRQARLPNDKVSLNQLARRLEGREADVEFTAGAVPLALIATGLFGEAAGANREQKRNSTERFEPGKETRETSDWAKKLVKNAGWVRGAVKVGSFLSRPSVALVAFGLNQVALQRRAEIEREIDRRAKNFGIDADLNYHAKLRRLREVGPSDYIGPAPQERSDGAARVRRIGRSALRASR